MATIVVHQPSAKRYLVLGSSHREQAFGVAPLVIVCDAAGTIHWLDSGDLRVAEVDGRTPDQLLKQTGYR